jgi:hypothetical protein
MGDIPLNGRLILKFVLREKIYDLKLLTEYYYHQGCDAM